MAESMEDVKRWRDRAEELRTIARHFNDTRSKLTVLQVAESYDRLADDVGTMLNRSSQQGKV